MISLTLSQPAVATSPEIDRLLTNNAPVAIGVSGGKDSTAVAFATIEHLDKIGHTGPRVLVHADLGATEWKDSLPVCQRLAERLGTELMIVRRPQGDMMERWEQRWADNLDRYLSLACVKLILPWSTPAMRFCTAELKVDQICRALSRRFPGQTIINATGIRRQESTERAKAPVSKPQKKLASTTRKTKGFDWHPIIDWQIEDVWNIMAARDFARHEAYSVYGASRVSCVWCILATEADHLAGMSDERNRELGRRMVKLEAASSFAFQGNRWLGDTLNEILSDEQRNAIARAKEAAAIREAAEAKIPKHLLYTKGWPTCVPTRDEAMLLGAVRFQVCDALNLRKTFINPDQIIERYEYLMSEKEKRCAWRTCRPSKSLPKRLGRSTGAVVTTTTAASRDGLPSAASAA